MTIPARQVARVVIGGEWLTVEAGSFEVIELGFDDDDGKRLHPPSGLLGYRFRTENRDTYIGPLSAIQLYKLVDY